jgi:hypothetical protein
MGTCNLATHQKEGLRLCTQALEEFFCHFRESADADSIGPRCEQLKRTFRQHELALIADGVALGETRKDMNALLNECVTACVRYRSSPKEEADSTALVVKLTGVSRVLNQLTAIAASQATVADPQPSQPAKGKVIRGKATEARDHWIYDECCKRTPYESIARNLPKKNPRWFPISSKQGILQAAKRYAERHGLPPPPSRQDR